ncbi:MAG TPA: ABC-F family ATP-binding cassette domain-containing protein [Thermodesulfobacteriota bacterium]|nr:ABC-F family ATP-binding cassette domain-containing protein [Thermodesulfobacteriota bacterium]
MIQVSNLSKSYNATPLFEDVTFSVGKNEIIGLVGRNGSGKSTLLKIISGLETYDEGGFGAPKGYKVGYLDQHIHFTRSTLLEECCQVLSAEEQYDHYKAEKILSGLGFTESDLLRPPSEFSGGFQLRINLTKTLLQGPDLLLLDEPTNYLDILSLRWLRRFLRGFRGEAILITHDREFMDSVTTHTMGIHRGMVSKIKGPTGKYYAQIMLDEEIHEKTRQNQEKKIKDLRKFVDRFGAKASKAAQAQSKLRQIEKMEVLAEIRPEYQLGFRFNYKPIPAKVCMQAEGLAFSYTKDPKDNLFENLSFQIKPEDRLAVIGRNGKGKTTLLNVLAQTAQPTAGSVKFPPGISVGYYQQTNRKDLNPDNTVAAEIAQANPHLSPSESRAICGAMMFSGDLARKKISVLSGGEQSRVLLGKILAHPANLLLLDEPSNHLDMDAIEVLTQEIKKFPGGVVIVTHNEEMLRVLANKLVIFHENRAEFFPGTYDEFLETIGWEEESSPERANEKSNGKSKEKPSNKHSKPEDAGPAKKQTRELKSLKKDYENMESEILKLEDGLKNKNEEVLRMVQERGDVSQIQELYKTIGKMQSRIDDCYSQMEELFRQGATP